MHFNSNMRVLVILRTSDAQIARSQRKSTIHDLSLKQRIFIGNTSMDTELSLIMANHAKISDGDLVFDPFVGSGMI